MSTIRNFCIVAHIDHGKSTLADRLLEFTGAVTKREMKAQLLDDMDLEREKGITIKAHAIQMKYLSKKRNILYTFNLIDTPGHVDFTYEVSRSLAACEGAILIIDASQGVEAQTISNLYLAIDAGLEIVPVVNKIDLPAADIPMAKGEAISLIGCAEEDIIAVSAKEGIGIEELLEQIIDKVPPPKEAIENPLKALIFDSTFDAFRGAIAYIRVFEGTLKKGDKIKSYATGKAYYADEIGVLGLKRVPTEILVAGEVGYIIGNIKEVADTKVGDTLTHVDRPATEPIEGYKEVKPMVFAGVYPTNSDDFEDLRASLDKLSLNDGSLFYEPDTSAALGFGFRCGFLGLLHMEIIQERLTREYNMDIITTVPNVEYMVYTIDGKVTKVDNPAHLANPSSIEHIEEPFIKAQIITPEEYIGAIMQLCIDRRGEWLNTHYIGASRVDMTFYLPLGEVIFDFYDKLKSISRGYASFDYEVHGYRPSHVIKLDIMLNGEIVDALSMIVHRDKAYDWGRKLTGKLKDLIPRQMFEIAVQASVGSKVIARETIKAMRKNVLAKCYGGDISRKRKLLEKQKEGKKRMKQVGNVEIPQEAFLAVLSMDDK
ncbi:MAG: translation elongation factor 4 [Bacteroidetes bacterium]|nr:translation elongation factor 4 [Bacteroidota bacterium]